MANYRFHDDAKANDVPRETLTRNVYERLRDQIIDGQIRPGDRMIRRTLSGDLGVSPMPVTEALYLLELDGLVESRPMLGCRVRPLTLEDLREDQVMREAIECQAARLVSEVATRSQLNRLMKRAKELDATLQAGRQDTKGSGSGMLEHMQFHLHHAELSGCQRLATELERVWRRLLMRLNWVKATRLRPVPKDWHQRLVQKIESRDVNEAEEAMRIHVLFGIEDDERALREYLRDQT